MISKAIPFLAVLFCLPLTLSAEDKVQDQKNQSLGKKLYTQHCAACHMADGSGAGMLQPALAASPLVLGDKNKLIDILFWGSSSIYAERASMNEMPGFSQLKDRDSAILLTYIRTNFGNKASKVSEKEVAEYRRSAEYSSLQCRGDRP